MMLPMRKIQNLYLLFILIIKFQQHVNKLENQICNQIKIIRELRINNKKFNFLEERRRCSKFYI